MAIRFRKSIKLAPGLKLNLNKKGVSLTVGGKYARVTTGSRGTTISGSAPGTGLSYQHKISSSPASNSIQPSRQLVGIPLQIMIDDQSGDLKLVHPSGQPLTEDQQKQIQKDYKPQLIESLEREIVRRETIHHHIKSLHTHIPEALNPPVFKTHPVPVLHLPPPPVFPWYTRFFALFFKGIKSRIHTTQQEHLQQCTQLKYEHTQRIQQHQDDEQARYTLFETTRYHDPDAMEHFLSQELSALEWPYETLVSFELRQNHTLIFDIDLPEIEDLPTQKTSLKKRPLGLKFKDMSQADQRRQYMNHIHAIGFLLLSMGFTRLPSVQMIILSGYSQRADPQTARIQDTYLYSLKATRETFSQIDRHHIDRLDVVACFELFELRRKMTKTGLFKPIEPFS